MNADAGNPWAATGSILLLDPGSAQVGEGNSAARAPRPFPLDMGSIARIRFLCLAGYGTRGGSLTGNLRLAWGGSDESPLPARARLDCGAAADPRFPSALRHRLPNAGEAGRVCL